MDGRASLALRVAFACALCATAVVLVLRPLFTSERRIDLRASVAPIVNGHDTILVFSRFRFFRFPADRGELSLLEDGVPLARPVAPHADIAALGSGRWSVVRGHVVHFSSSDGSDVATNGRRYELVYVPDVVRSLPALAVYLLTGALGLALARARGVSLRGPSRPRTRAALGALVALALGAGVVERWDHVNVVPDTYGYITRTPTRTFLYPTFARAFDRTPDAPVPPPPDRQAARVFDGRFTNIARAQKVLAVAAIVALFAALATSFDAWCLGALFLLCSLLDPVLGETFEAGIWANVENVASEGLNHSLVFLHVACAFLALARFTRPRAIALALVTSLLILNRPANAPVALVFPALAFSAFRELGWRRALGRAAVVGLVCAAPVLAECARNLVAHGAFRLDTFGGGGVIGLALEAAEPDDADAFEDPRLRAFVSECLRDPRRGVPRADARGYGLSVNVNTHEIAIPAYVRAFGDVERWEDSARMDATFGKVARRLIARHPVAYLRLGFRQLGLAIDLLTVACAVVVVVALALHRRASSPELAFVGYCALLPLVALALVCFTQAPLDRYRSQTWFLEVSAVPLVAMALAKARVSEKTPTPGA